ncbi:hypothetical protein [Paraburkholderia sp. DHOC27]|uniref:hypothetical protein n=1 Tax=Paraburkholderia sp. DHOC27 TaxID=2303330 RepID=UPI0015F3194D|nr:hypothetical protein [Paraburkholderia sp. DHOC27]
MAAPFWGTVHNERSSKIAVEARRESRTVNVAQPKILTQQAVAAYMPRQMIQLA